MNELVIHPASLSLLQRISQQLPQALLLTGDDGVGLSTIAAALAKQHSATPVLVQPEKDAKVDIDNGTITIDIVRRLYTDTRTKQSSKRVIVIDSAERMTHQAQNAFLKLLEEPNESTYFILASHSLEQLLPTVRSRMQHLHINQATTEQSKQLLTTLDITDATKRTQLLYMADGLPAELHRLASDEARFSVRADMMRDARTLLQGTPYQKLLVAHGYRDDRPKSLALLDTTISVARRTLSKSMQPELVMYLDRLTNAHGRIAANGNIRLCIATLVI